MGIAFTFDSGKAVGVITSLAASSLPEFTKGKACKLVFLADHMHFVRYGRPITGDWFAAMENGPVPSNILNLLKAVEAGTPLDETASILLRILAIDRRYEYPRISADRAINRNHLSRSDTSVLSEVIDRYGQFSFEQLRSLTHDFEAYRTAWERRFGSGAGTMRFEEFFDGEEAGIDAIEGVREEVLEDAALREAFSGHDN